MIKSIDEVFEPLVAQAILNLVSKGATITGDGRDIGAEVRDRAAEINERYETWRQEHGSQPTLNTGGAVAPAPAAGLNGRGLHQQKDD